MSTVLDDLNGRLKKLHKSGAISKLAVQQVYRVVRDEMKTGNVDADRAFDEIEDRSGVSERAKPHIRSLLDELFADRETAMPTPMVQTNGVDKHDDMIVSRDIRTLSDEVDAVNRRIGDVLSDGVLQAKFEQMLERYRSDARLLRMEEEVLHDMGQLLDKYDPRGDRSWIEEIAV
jgi:hypothetical protein